MTSPLSFIEMAGESSVGVACCPSQPTLMRRVVPAPDRSRRNTSQALFVSPGTRLLASDRNAMNRPSALTSALPLMLLPGACPIRNADDFDPDPVGARLVEHAVAIQIAVADHELLAGRRSGREQRRRARAKHEKAAIGAQDRILARVVAQLSVGRGARVDEGPVRGAHDVDVANRGLVGPQPGLARLEGDVVPIGADDRRLLRRAVEHLGLAGQTIALEDRFGLGGYGLYGRSAPNTMYRPSRDTGWRDMRAAPDGWFPCQM